MDRFIDAIGVNSNFNMKNLKSNMDRFIVKRHFCVGGLIMHLKSNMDRFIGFNTLTH